MKAILFAAILTSLLVSSRNARAALGDDSNGPEHDRASLQGTRSVRDLGTYKVQDIQYGGTTLHEYVSPEGSVFALTWSGIAHPDLSMVLGKYWDEYRSAKKAAGNPRGRHHQKIQTANMVFETNGHMRAVVGRVYIQSLMPEDVSVGELQ